MPRCLPSIHRSKLKRAKVRAPKECRMGGTEKQSRERGPRAISEQTAGLLAWGKGGHMASAF